MVVVGVAGDEQVEMLDAQRMQRRKHGRLAQVEIGRVSRTRVVNERVVFGANHHRQTLPHIQHP